MTIKLELGIDELQSLGLPSTSRQDEVVAAVIDAVRRNSPSSALGSGAPTTSLPAPMLIGPSHKRAAEAQEAFQTAGTCRETPERRDVAPEPPRFDPRASFGVAHGEHGKRYVQGGHQFTPAGEYVGSA